METSLFYIPDREIDAYINALTDPVPEEARAAVSGLKSMGVHALDRLGQALTDGGPELRLGVVQVIAAIRDAEAAPYLVAALADGEPGVRQAAQAGLLAMPQLGLPALLQRLASGKCPPRLCEGAQRVLEGLEKHEKLEEPVHRLLEVLDIQAAGDQISTLAKAALSEVT